MSENFACDMFVNNKTGAVMSLTDSGLDYGKWTISPPPQINTGTVAEFKAEGAKGSATGTTGSVTYTLGDNATTIKISFSIPYSGDNTGGLTMGGASPSNYTAEETDSAYATPQSFPATDHVVEAYFLIGVPKTPDAAKAPSLTEAVLARLAGRGAAAVLPTIDVASIARATDCGELPGPELLRLAAGRTSVNFREILEIETMPSGDLVRFVTEQRLLPVHRQFEAALAFAEAALPALRDHASVQDLARRALAEMRGLMAGSRSSALDQLEQPLLAARTELRAQLGNGRRTPEVGAVEAVLACMYKTPAAAALSAGSCVRASAPSKEAYQAISDEQLAFLKALPD